MHRPTFFNNLRRFRNNHPRTVVSLCLVLCGIAGRVGPASGQNPVEIYRTEQSDTARDNKTAIRALMIAGGCCHDYASQTGIVREHLDATERPIVWTILRYGSTRDIYADVYRSGNWIDDYDIVIHNECFGGVDDPKFIDGIVDGHLKRGIPAIFLHCSMHSYRNADNADRWRQLVGVTSRRHERSKGPIELKISDGMSDDAIAKALGSSWTTPNGELYLIEKVWPTTEVIATAHSTETDSRHPVIWRAIHNADSADEPNDGSKNDSDRGVPTRVFATTLGHHNETMAAEPYGAMLRSAWDWCLQGP